MRFSLDSVSTAAGMADDEPVKVIASVIAVGVMIFASKTTGGVLGREPEYQDAGIFLMADGSCKH